MIKTLEFCFIEVHKETNTICICKKHEIICVVCTSNNFRWKSFLPWESKQWRGTPHSPDLDVQDQIRFRVVPRIFPFLGEGCLQGNSHGILTGNCKFNSNQLYSVALSLVKTYRMQNIRYCLSTLKIYNPQIQLEFRLRLCSLGTDTFKKDTIPFLWNYIPPPDIMQITCFCDLVWFGFMVYQSLCQIQFIHSRYMICKHKSIKLNISKYCNVSLTIQLNIGHYFTHS